MSYFGLKETSDLCYISHGGCIITLTVNTVSNDVKIKRV